MRDGSAGDFAYLGPRVFRRLDRLRQNDAMQRVLALSDALRNRWHVLMRVRTLQQFGLGLAMMLAAAMTLAAKPWPWPLPSGELTGELAPSNAPEGTQLAWKLTVERTAGARQKGTLTAEGAGARLHVDWTLDAEAAGPRFHWTVREAEFDLARWWSVARRYLPEEYNETSATGELSLSGEGTWREGELGGRAALRLANARIEAPSRKLTLEAVALALEFEELATWRTAPQQVLTFTNGTFDVLPLAAGRLEFRVDGDAVRVNQASVEVLGGIVSTEPFDVSREKGEFTVKARAEGLMLAQLQPLLPSIVTEARGRVDGELVVRRTADGVQIGDGYLKLRADETALLRLVTNSDVLLRSVPAEVLKIAPGIAGIEAGQTPLLAHRLDVQFTPAGDEQGRTAVLRIEGEPVDQKVRVPLVVDVNVRGPLEQLVKFGTDSRLRFGGQP